MKVEVDISPKRKSAKWKWIILFTFVTLFMLYILIQYVVFSPKDAGIVQGKLQQTDFPYTPWIYFLCVHIAAGSVALVTGPFQFLKRPTGKAASLHRKLGYSYAAAIAAGGLSGMYLSYYATGGPATGLGFLMLDLCWLVSTSIAMQKIFQKKFIEHQNWMLRSYAVTLAFVSFRVLLIPIKLLGHLHIESAMSIAAWLCWIVNLGIAERMIRRKGAMGWRQRNTSSSAY
jgi:hypothetical protein